MGLTGQNALSIKGRESERILPAPAAEGDKRAFLGNRGKKKFYDTKRLQRDLESILA